MTIYRGQPLVVRRDRTVIFGDSEIGTVFGDPSDSRINHGWVYRHISGTTEVDVQPNTKRYWQSAFTKVDAAKFLADLHLKITASGRG